MPCPRTQHLNNVPRLRGEKHDISLKILHQAGFETARQAATSAERHALTIAPCPSLSSSSSSSNSSSSKIMFNVTFRHDPSRHNTLVLGDPMLGQHRRLLTNIGST